MGNLAPTTDLPLQTVVTREISLLGSCASCGEYPTCLELMESGKIDVNPLITALGITNSSNCTPGGAAG